MKIAIIRLNSRTIIKQNKIVILDDPTGGLDNDTKNVIYKNIKKYLKELTKLDYKQN